MPLEDAPPPMRLAVIAPPTITVPRSALGGLDMVRWLAEGLAVRRHHVTLISAEPAETGADGMVIFQTSANQHRTSEAAAKVHADEAAELLERLELDLVADHSRGGYLPPTPTRCSVRTIYDTSRLFYTRPPAHVGLVPISRHQYQQAAGDPALPIASWLETIHPAIPMEEFPVSADRDGPVVCVGSLGPGRGVDPVIDAAHMVGRPLVLAGTDTAPELIAEARVNADVHLRPKLSGEDELLEQVSVSERWDLLANACCLVAPVWRETAFSLETLEAMAMGTPVVGYQRSVIAEQVIDGRSGVLTTGPSGLARAITRAAELDRAGVRASAEGRFALGEMVDAYERLFGRLLRGRG
jgi:glycosyltransferase involved in cell wall biosynthesis